MVVGEAGLLWSPLLEASLGRAVRDSSGQRGGLGEGGEEIRVRLSCESSCFARGPDMLLPAESPHLEGEARQALREAARSAQWGLAAEQAGWLWSPLRD